MNSARRLLAGGLTVLALTIAACTTPPAKTGDDLNDVLAEMSTDLQNIERRPTADTFAALVEAIRPQKERLLQIAEKCRTPADLPNNALKAHCYAVSAQAYTLLAELPEQPATPETPKNIMASRAIQDGTAACRELPKDNRHCHALESMNRTIETTDASRVLARMLDQPGDIDPVVATGVVETFNEAAAKNWPGLASAGGGAPDDAAAIEIRTRMMRNAACRVSFASQSLSPRFARNQQANVLDFRKKVGVALHTAARTIPIEPEDPATCTAAIDAPACLDSRYDRLVTMCGVTPWVN